MSRTLKTFGLLCLLLLGLALSVMAQTPTFPPQIVVSGLTGNNANYNGTYNLVGPAGAQYYIQGTDLSQSGPGINEYRSGGSYYGWYISNYRYSDGANNNNNINYYETVSGNNPLGPYKIDNGTSPAPTVTAVSAAQSAAAPVVFSFLGSGGNPASNVAIWGAQSGESGGVGGFPGLDGHITGTFTGTELDFFAGAQSVNAGNQVYAFIDGSTNSTVFTSEALSAQWMTGPTGLTDTTHTYDIFYATGGGSFGYDTLFRVTGANPAMGLPAPRTGSTWPTVYNFGVMTNVIADVGDSRTFGQAASLAGGGTQGTSYPADLYNSLGGFSAHYFVSNLGIPGAEGVSYGTRAASDVDTQYNANNKSNTVIYWYGYNDAHAGQTLAQMQATVQQFVAARHAKGWKVLVGTIPDASGSTELTQYNAWLSQAGNPSGADKISDVASNPNLVMPVNPTYWYSDNIHFTDAGYMAIANQFKTDYLAMLTPVLSFTIGLSTNNVSFTTTTSAGTGPITYTLSRSLLPGVTGTTITSNTSGSLVDTAPVSGVINYYTVTAVTSDTPALTIISKQSVVPIGAFTAVAPKLRRIN